MIMQAQANSRLHGGMDGISKKVNTTSNFCADSRDIVGQWVCTPTGQENTFPPNINGTLIAEILVDQGLLFSQVVFLSFEYHGSSPADGLFILSASQTPSPYRTEPWQVHAAVDVTLNPLNEKLMKICLCSIDAPSIGCLLSLVEAYAAVENWIDIVKEAIYPSPNIATPPSDPVDLGPVIASNLNSIMMIAGSSMIRLKDVSHPACRCHHHSCCSSLSPRQAQSQWACI